MLQEFISSDDIFENCLHTRDLIRKELSIIFQRDLNSKIEFYNFLKKFFPFDPEVKRLERQLLSIMKLN